MDNAIRKSMIKIIFDMTELRGYNVETSILAVNISDHYLIKLAKKNQEKPCLIQLAISSVLIAAKLELNDETPFKDTIKFLRKHQDIKLKRQNLIDFEAKILKACNFSFHFETSFNFLERFLKIFGIEKSEEKGLVAVQLQKLAKEKCHFMQQDCNFLDYRPSQIAAVALLFSVHVGFSEVASKFGIIRIEEARVRILFSEIVVPKGSEKGLASKVIKDPLCLWNRKVEEITFLVSTKDILPVYLQFVDKLSEKLSGQKDQNHSRTKRKERKLNSGNKPQSNEPEEQ